MSRWLSLIVLGIVLWASFVFGRSYELRPIAGVYRQGPRAVLTIEYNEPAKGFEEGDLYILKVLKVRGTKIDWGFVRIATEED